MIMLHTLSLIRHRDVEYFLLLFVDFSHNLQVKCTFRKNKKKWRKKLKKEEKNQGKPAKRGSQALFVITPCEPACQPVCSTVRACPRSVCADVHASAYVGTVHAQRPTWPVDAYSVHRPCTLAAVRTCFPAVQTRFPVHRCDNLMHIQYFSFSYLESLFSLIFLTIFYSSIE